MRKKIFMLVVFTFLGTTTLLAMGRRLEGALNPILLWEKEFPGSEIKDSSVGLARLTGDVILFVGPETAEAEEPHGLLIIDKDGNVSEGPEDARDGRISDDGSRIIYTTGPPDEFFVNRVHYVTRDWQELWSTRIGAKVYISSDGSLVVDASIAAENTQQIRVYNSNGEKIWVYKLAESINVLFSPDSNYIIANSYIFPDKNRESRVYASQTGKLLWKKDGERIRSTSEGITFLVGLKGLYDKEGNLIFDKGTVVSENGKELIVCYPEKIELLLLPEKTVSKAYPVKTKDLGFSYDGRYLAVMGERTDVISPNNLFVIDTETDEIWEIKIEPKGESEFNQMQIFLTKDGKYMLIQAKGKLYYYQLY